MSSETKQEVFDEVRYKFRNFKNEHCHGMYASPDSIDHYLSDALKRYAAALPDDLPVIPKAVSEWLTWCKRKHHSLKDALDGETRVSEDGFARAWVLGVWRVEETLEVVKL